MPGQYAPLCESDIKIMQKHIAHARSEERSSCAAKTHKPPEKSENAMFCDFLVIMLNTFCRNEQEIGVAKAQKLILVVFFFNLSQHNGFSSSFSV